MCKFVWLMKPIWTVSYCQVSVKCTLSYLNLDIDQGVLKLNLLLCILQLKCWSESLWKGTPAKYEFRVKASFYFRTSTSQSGIQLCGYRLCWPVQMAEFFLLQENGLHLLQRWNAASASAKYRTHFYFFHLWFWLAALFWHSVCNISVCLFFSLVEQGFCSNHWIPYNGHCFYLQRAAQTWSDAQRECRKEGGDLASLRNVEDQSFAISQLGYGTRQSWQLKTSTAFQRETWDCITTNAHRKIIPCSQTLSIVLLLDVSWQQTGLIVWFPVY